MTSIFLKLIFTFLAHRMSGDSEQEGTFSNKARKLEALLAAKLTEFLASKVIYGMRRVLAAEAAHLYRGPDTGTPCTTPSTALHSSKGL